MRRSKADRAIELRHAPKWAWDTIDETLALDAESSAFDLALRREIDAALNEMRPGPPGQQDLGKECK